MIDQVCVDASGSSYCDVDRKSYLTRFPVPADADALKAYEAGFIAYFCLKPMHRSSSCFERSLENSRFSDFQPLKKTCHELRGEEKKIDCYGMGYMEVHDKAGPSCESKLDQMRTQLMDLDNRVTNLKEMKSGIDGVLKEIQNNPALSGSPK